MEMFCPSMRQSFWNTADGDCHLGVGAMSIFVTPKLLLAWLPGPGDAGSSCQLPNSKWPGPSTQGAKVAHPDTLR